MATGKNLGVDLGTSGGDWLFRQEGLVLGPVPGTRLVEMLNANEIDGRTEVAPMGSTSFKRLAEVDFFKVHYAKAEAKRRVDAAAEADRAVQAKSRTVKIAVIGGVAFALVIAAALVARHLAIHNPWKDADELALADISVEAPTITVARAYVDEEDLVEYPTGGRPPATRPTTATAQPKAPTTPTETAAVAKPPPTRPDRPPKTVAAATTTRPPKVTDPSADPDGMQMAQFDQEAINSVVAAQQKKLYPCFIDEAKRTPGLAERIPLEFVIGNEGRVVKLWVDHPRFKTGPLYDCLFRELKKWPFKAYEGERATVNLSFNIGKKR